MWANLLSSISNMQAVSHDHNARSGVKGCMIFRMTAPIKFELPPRGTLNSLKFAHEYL